MEFAFVGIVMLALGYIMGRGQAGDYIRFLCNRIDTLEDEKNALMDEIDWQDEKQEDWWKNN